MLQPVDSIPGVKSAPPSACKWCGEPAFAHTDECGRCWELRVRIQADLELAEEMVWFLRACKDLEKEREEGKNERRKT